MACLMICEFSAFIFRLFLRLPERIKESNSVTFEEDISSNETLVKLIFLFERKLIRFLVYMEPLSKTNNNYLPTSIEM